MQNNTTRLRHASTHARTEKLDEFSATAGFSSVKCDPSLCTIMSSNWSILTTFWGKKVQKIGFWRSPEMRQMRLLCISFGQM